MRKYKSGTKWCVWRWTQVKNPTNEFYLKRLHLLKTPWFSVYLHWIRSEDFHITKSGIPILHSHPVDFLSVILKGSYVEITDIIGLNFFVFNDVKWFNWIPHNKKHHICKLNNKEVLTLCFAGPARQKWGYYLMNENTEQFDYIPWDKYKNVQ